MTELVYIGGYGRSGSTLLESLLATRPDVLACGEVLCCLRKRVDGPCTCGETRYDCGVWSPFYTVPGRLRGWTHEALALALLGKASGRYNLLIDSSKTAWGALSTPFKLRRTLGRKFHLIHVVRDPRGVCWSNAGGAWKRRARVKSPALRHLKTSLGWWAANLSCELFGRLYPEQYQRVRYEDLARSHAAILDGLFAKLAPGKPATAAGAQAAINRHQLYGNSARYRDPTANIREDVRWKSRMPAAQQTLVAALAWPLRLRYGY